MDLSRLIAERLTHKRLEESHRVPEEDIIAKCMSTLYKRYGPMNGGECGTVAYYVSDMLESVVDYSFSGTLIDGGLSHVMIKCNGNYYDATNATGYADISGETVVDNLELVEQDSNAIPASIGNDEVGWVDCFRAPNSLISIIQEVFDGR